jgi:hypothetical protein
VANCVGSVVVNISGRRVGVRLTQAWAQSMVALGRANVRPGRAICGKPVCIVAEDCLMCQFQRFLSACWTCSTDDNNCSS